MIGRATIFASVFMLALTLASAEETEPSRGRLPDGRAFRTDAEGNQLVDYIAELELGIEALNRRIESLQDEVDEQKVSLDNCRNGIAEGLTEKTLVGAQEAAVVPTPTPDPEPDSSKACEDRFAALKAEFESVRDDRDVIRMQMAQLVRKIVPADDAVSMRGSLAPPSKP